MKCKILHESRGRMRVHMKQYRMTMPQADLLEYYLKEIDGVRDVKVSERTGNAIIYFKPQMREQVVSALSSFNYEEASLVVSVPEQTGRQLTHEYQDRMFYHIMRRGISRLFFPVSIRRVISTAKAIPYVWKGLRDLARGKLSVSVLDATSILVSLLHGDFDTAGNIMFLLGVGDIMEEWTHRKSVMDLAGAMALSVDQAWLVAEGGQEVLVDLSEVSVGDEIIVRSGSTIPLDGKVLSGDGSVNQASLTGESLPVHKSEGAVVYAGTVLEEGELHYEVTKSTDDSKYHRIVQMIEDSERLKSASEAKAAHLADRLVPYTFGATLLTYLFTRDVTRATSILMVDFCCALKLAMPISVLSAMREAQMHGISVKGGKFLEAVAEAETMVFDKTGTLTKATPKVVGVEVFDKNMDADEALRLAACLEEHYPHSIANAVVREAEEKGLLHEERHSKVEYVVAHGIRSTIDNKPVSIGSYHFIFEDEGIKIYARDKKRFENLPAEYSHLYMSVGKYLSAVILIEDPLKEEAKEAVAKLHDQGIHKIVMMTGDSDRTAKAVAEAVGVDAYYSEVLPEDKAGFVAKERAEGRKVIMIGDGINDSPALSEADAGIAVGTGAAIAREISDITIVTDSLEALVLLRRLAEAQEQRIHQNYRRILGFNSLLIFLGMLGILPPTATAALHNGSTIFISLHSLKNLLPESEK